MIGTLLRVGWLSLRRDWVALALVFLLPVVFFSIFAVIFGRPRGADSDMLQVLVVDEDQSPMSRRLIAAFSRQPGLRVEAHTGQDNNVPKPEDSRGEAQRLVRQGKYTAAIVIPSGWGNWLVQFSPNRPAVVVIHDAANPFAQPMVTGQIQAAALSALRDLASDAVRQWRGGARAIDALSDNRGEPTATDPASMGLVRVDVVAARAVGMKDHRPNAGSMVPYYAAGIGVMFLLFSMAGASASLLDEEESGTLDRLLSSQIGMGTLLLSKWIFFAILGVAQVTVMFLWGEAVFGLGLWTANHLAGFVWMTLATAAAAAAFGILLATICRSRAQLSGMSTIVILIMSALGGSMVPRFFMPSFIKTTALFTFNGWALDGYLKVFWNDDPGATVAVTLWDLLPQTAMLCMLTIVFLLVARLLARRWERA